MVHIQNALGRQKKSRRRRGIVVGLLTILVLVVAACGTAVEPTIVPAPTAAPTSPPASTGTPVVEPMVIPSVAVSDQALADGSVSIAEVVSDGPGWLVIHAQADGKPGPLLGFSPVADGENSDTEVSIDASGATGTLYAMLHPDAGQVGTWEFPGGPDTPVTAGDQVVTPTFVVEADRPATLPETRGTTTAWMLGLLAAGGLLLAGGLARRRKMS